MKAIPLILTAMLLQSSFKQSQLTHARVKLAYAEKETLVKSYFKNQNIQYAGFNLFIRAFKNEGNLEVWVKQKDTDTFSLLHTYSFCSTSGLLGPKRKEGDLQIPEGIYEINHFNPQSNFYLSLGINYPNASDKILSDAKHPGGDIYIHGNCVTVGCIPLTDDKIKELYVLAVEAKSNGQDKIPVHIFPDRLSADMIQKIGDEFSTNKATIQLWNDLQLIYKDFESSKKIKPLSIDAKGKYSLKK